MVYIHWRTPLRTKTVWTVLFLCKAFPNSSSGLIFCKNPGKTKILWCCRFFPFRARSEHYFAVREKSQKSGRHPGDFPQMPGYPGAPGFIKSHKCNHCNYASSHASTLKAHLKIHSGEKSNKCNQCDYASSEADHLKRHFISHSGEKSDKCYQCDFASSLKVNLSTHLKAHNG